MKLKMIAWCTALTSLAFFASGAFWCKRCQKVHELVGDCPEVGMEWAWSHPDSVPEFMERYDNTNPDASWEQPDYASTLNGIVSYIRDQIHVLTEIRIIREYLDLFQPNGTIREIDEQRFRDRHIIRATGPESWDQSEISSDMDRILEAIKSRFHNSGDMQAIRNALDNQERRIRSGEFDFRG